MIDSVTAMSPAQMLPYGPRLARWLRPVQRGFLAVNALLGPALGIGLGKFIGNPLTGRLMLLHTRGRRTGRLRGAPLGYVLRDGAIWCVAGYGRRTPWFLNLEADRTVEVRLPDRSFRGVAKVVDDPDEWLSSYRDLIASFGLIGRVVVGDVRTMSDEALLARHRSLPVVRIDPADGSRLEPGLWDRGPAGVAVVAGWLGLLIALAAAAAIPPLRRRHRVPGAS
jgi:deazaflavin-dependent oxidoreductase (nitroreductase family)